MGRKHALAVLLLVALPFGAHAEVRISEVAWMGTASNANAEWIELHNSGSDAVPLAGWKLTSSTGSPTISLSGTLAGNGYYLLTRTSTTIIPGVTGDLAYSGALANSGATLTLTDGTNATVDAVIGGTNWANIGGDNTSKQTPQLTDAGTWVTADPTPRAATAVSSAGNSATSTSSGDASTTPAVSIGGTVAHTTNPSFPQLYIDAGANRIVTTHMDTPYTATVYGSNGQAAYGVLVTWTFGDGTQDTGSAALHAYESPGTYLAVVRATDGRSETIKTLTVEVQDANIAIEARPEGIAVRNESGRIADISHWKLESGGRSFDLPADSALLPGSTVVFAPAITGIATSTDAKLRYPDGRVMATVENVPSPEPLAAEEEVPAPLAAPHASAPLRPAPRVLAPVQTPAAVLAALANTSFMDFLRSLARHLF